MKSAVVYDDDPALVPDSWELDGPVRGAACGGDGTAATATELAAVRIEGVGLARAVSVSASASASAFREQLPPLLLLPLLLLLLLVLLVLLDTLNRGSIGQLPPGAVNPCTNPWPPSVSVGGGNVSVANCVVYDDPLVPENDVCDSSTLRGPCLMRRMACGGTPMLCVPSSQFTA